MFFSYPFYSISLLSILFLCQSQIQIAVLHYMIFLKFTFGKRFGHLRSNLSTVLQYISVIGSSDSVTENSSVTEFSSSSFSLNIFLRGSDILSAEQSNKKLIVRLI